MPEVNHRDGILTLRYRTIKRVTQQPKNHQVMRPMEGDKDETMEDVESKYK